MYYDSNGLIVQQDMDGGDTAGREGDYWFAQALYAQGPCGLEVSQLEEFDRVLTLLQASPGVFIRHPRANPIVPPEKAWNDPSDFSRDQAISIILALGEMCQYDILRPMLWQQIKRLGVYQNFSMKWSKDKPDNDNDYKQIYSKLWIKGDIGGPQDINYYIRGFKAWYLWPILLLGDLFLLTNSCIRVIVGNDDNTSDDINHTLALKQAQRHLSTPISWLARKIYKWFRRGGIQHAWDQYFKPESGANEFNEIYRELISEM